MPQFNGESYPVLLLDSALTRVKEEAQRSGADVGSFLSVWANKFFGHDDSEQAAGLQRVGAPAGAAASNPFDLRPGFPGYPDLSIELGQAFIDEALKLPDVKAYKSGKAVGFIPRFAYLDYPISHRGARPGIVVSLYGAPNQFNHSRQLFGPGRNSYARARIHSVEDLAYCLPLLREAYERRLGKTE